MIKTITLALLSTIFFVNFGYGQSQRMVLAEESTSSTCGPCAAQNPAFDALLQANADIVTSIKYHVWWPSPGNDPMYLQNTVDNAARTNYYSINGVPQAVINGGSYQGQPSGVSQSMLNNASNVPSPFEIQIQQSLSDNNDEIFLTTLIHATEDVSGNMFAHLAVIEKHISFTSPPGTNGEKDFYNVMKKLLPTKSGTALPSSMAAGDYIILQNSWKLANVYNIDELAAVGFVQDNTTKNVHQAANSSTSAIVPVYNIDAEMNSVSYTTSTNCSGMITPSVTIRNNGASNLTSMTINYSVNGGEEMVYGWTGNLGFLETETIELSDLSFAVADTNFLVISGVNTNGVGDDYTTNNTFTYPILKAPDLSGSSIVFLKLDENPEETTWEIRNSAGEVVQSGGPYTTSGQKIIPITVTDIDCYNFVIYDAGGDGTEYYAVVYGNNQIAFEGNDFGDMEQNEFSYGTVGIEPVKEFTDMQVYPNPVTDRINIEFYLTEPSDVTISVIDIVGKVVSQINPGQINAGPQKFNVDANQLKPGVYMLQVKAGNTVHTEKISIQ